MKIQLPYCSCGRVSDLHMEAWFERLLIGDRDYQDQHLLDSLIEQSGLRRPICSPINAMGVVRYVANISISDFNEPRRMCDVLVGWLPQAAVGSTREGYLRLNGKTYPEDEWQRSGELDLEVLRLLNNGTQPPVYRLGVAEVDRLVNDFLEQL